MRRVYISYVGADSEAALYVTNQLRADGADVFFDPDRLLNIGSFSRRLQKEIMARGCLLLIQTPTALESPLVQAELEFAYRNRIEIIPLVLQPMNIRETGEFRFLLTLQPIDFTTWFHHRQTTKAFYELDARLNHAHDQGVFSVYNAAHIAPSATLEAHTSWVREVTFSPDGSLLASCANDNTICFWDMRLADRTGAPPPLFAQVTENDKLLWSVKFAPRHALVASADLDGIIRLWDLNSLPTPYEFTRFAEHRGTVYSLAFSADGYLLASASRDQRVLVRDISNIDVTGQANQTVEFVHNSPVYWVTFSPDHYNRSMATTSWDGIVRVWHMDTDDLSVLAKRQPIYLKGHTSWVNSATFSPNGLMLASAGNDHAIHLWDVQHGDLLAILTGHTDSVNTVAFSSDGSLLASAAKDDTVRLWDVNSLREVGVFKGHERGVNSIVFSPDGTKLVTGSGDSSIKIWTLSQQMA